jgi:hypothetical protein
MKKVFFILFIVLVVGISSCQTGRRGVQFYSGDKNTTVVSDQISLTNQKKTEYEIKLRRLQTQRERILSSVKNEQVIEIRRLENENRRLNHQLKNLKNSPQRISGDGLLNEIERIDEELSSNEKRLQNLYQSPSYPGSASNLDSQISQIEDLLLNLQINEDEMLVQMNQKDGLDYFQGNIRNGYEAANAYLLMKWASDNTGNSINHQSSFDGLIINEYHQPVTATIRHSNGYTIVLRIDRRSEQEIELPFPGRYISYFEGTFGKSNLVTHNVTPTGTVFANDKKYDFLSVKHKW